MIENNQRRMSKVFVTSDVMLRMGAADASPGHVYLGSSVSKLGLSAVLPATFASTFESQSNHRGQLIVNNWLIETT